MARVIVTRFSALGDVTMLAVIMPEILAQNPDVEFFMVTRPEFKYLFPKNDNFKFVGVDVDKDYKGLWGLRRLAQKLKREIKPTHFADCHNVLRTQILSRLMHVPKTAVLDKGRAEKRELTRRKDKKLHQLESMHERYADVFRKLKFPVKLSHQLPDYHCEKSGIGIAPFAYYSEKMLPIERSRELALKLAREGKEVILFGGGELEARILAEWEQEHENIISLAGKFDFNEELKVMRRLELMITMDSANMHLSSLAGTRVVSVWGATHPYLGFLGYGQSINDCVQKDLFCRPCSVYGNKPCYRKTKECIETIQVEEILAKI